uniref:Retrovirus-related Pol polyprotein from transposon TNT 1-94 n=1 Tax=Tanacetum cinerariifolium TaxID=118510 RepID=A0A699H910_TANCI|nr:retrovirus-related Pol polyprotein from transposon TNT 1-94 [Tanacetum cinerariifolium]
MVMRPLGLISPRWSVTTDIKEDTLLGSKELQEVKIPSTWKAQEDICLWKHLLQQLWYHVMVVVVMIGVTKLKMVQLPLHSWLTLLQVITLSTSKINTITYKTGLESVKARLIVYKKNESVYEEDIKLLKRNFLPPKLNLSGLKEFVNESIVTEPTVKKPEVKTNEAKASANKPKVIMKKLMKDMLPLEVTPKEKKSQAEVIHALKDPSWIEAMQKELLQFKLQEVWTLVDFPYGKRAIGTKWVFRNKKDERGIVIRNKAILVAQGHTQEEGINYDEVFAPVARIEAIRLFLAYASFKDFAVYQMDVKSVFLYGKIKEGIYVCQPPGFKDPNFPDKVYKVEKALYGLHQAPRAWYETLSTYLLENRFHRGKIDKTLFIRRHKDDILLVQVYVDDIIFGSSKKELFKNVSTPMKTQKPLLKDEDGKEVDVHMYRSMIGSLMYLTSSRSDIMFAVCIVDFLNANPIKYALTVNPTVYTSCIEQFLAIVKAKTINGKGKLQALVDGKKIIITESNIRIGLQLDNAEGVDCLPNAVIFEQLALMGTMASTIICLSTNQKFNFSKYIFESMVKKLDNVNKFLMYPRNMKMIGKGFSRRDTPLFPTMMVQAQEDMGEGLANPTNPYHTPTITQPSTSQPQRLRKTKRKDNELPQTSVPTSVADKAINKEMDDSLERATTTATSLDAKQDRGNVSKTQSKATPNEPGSQGTNSGGGPRYQETMGDTAAQTRSERVSKISNDPQLARFNTP